MRIVEGQTELTKEQKKMISKVISRRMRMTRSRKIRQLKEWMKIHRN